LRNLLFKLLYATFKLANTIVEGLR